MATYFYQATDQTGKVIEGDIEATTLNNAVDKVRKLNYLPIKLTEDKPRQSITERMRIPGRSNRLSAKELLQFTQQLATLVTSGLTLDRSLAITVQLTDSDSTRNILADIQKRVHAGSTFGDALTLYPQVFSKLYINMIRAGEVGGVLNTVLHRLADYLEKTADMKRKVLTSLIYPIILVVFGGAAVVFLMTWVVPKFSQIFSGMEDTLPFITAALIEVSAFVTDYWWVVILMMAAMALGFASLLNGLLTETFYAEWTTFETSLFLMGMALLIGLFAAPKPLWILYASGAGLVIFIVGWAWYQFVQFKLFPAVTVTAGTLTIFTGLVVGLQMAASRERAFIQRAFSKYLSPLLVEGLIESPNLLKSGGEERFMTVFFSDLAGFTSIAEMTEPPELAAFMNDYFTDMTGIVLDNGGIIHQYSGDSIMASFGTPVSMPDHANRALLVALKMQRRLEVMRKAWKEKGYPQLRQRIGINTGKMFFGNLGSQQVFYYSVLGDAVNLGARLESANKFYGTDLMISEFTYQNINLGRFHTRVLDIIKVKGKKKAVRVYEVFGETSEALDPERVNYYQAYDEALGAYLDKDFAQSLEHFARALTFRPDDKASQALIDRIKMLDNNNLPKDWDGSVALTSK